MISSVINRYKKQRKYKQLSAQYKKQYAFVGIGNHSINNLYPVLDYLHVPIKYIVTHTDETANVINKSNWQPQAVHDFDIALNDPEIEGVLISAAPKSHYSLIRKALEKGKNVFVEKPPCYTLNELDDLIQLQQSVKKDVVVGLQKRYAPAYGILKKKLSSVQYYSMRYCTGAYPEGDALMDLFIHPTDIVSYLFGDATVKSVIKIKDSTILAQVVHKNGVAGILELSTDYAWQTSTEQLTVVCKNGVFELNTPAELLFKNKPSVIANIPVEKVLKFTLEIKVLFNQNSFIPTLQHNNLYINGFYNEISNFVNLCEGKGGKNLSDLKSLIPTYKLLDSLKYTEKVRY